MSFGTVILILIFLFTSASAFTPAFAQNVFDGNRTFIFLKEPQRQTEIRDIIENTGGHIIHIFPPRLLHAYTTEETRHALLSKNIAEIMTEDLVDTFLSRDLSQSETIGLRVWNDLFVNTVEFAPCFEKEVKVAPAEPLISLSFQANTPAQSGTSATSTFLVGTVSVGIIFVNTEVDDPIGSWHDKAKEEISRQIYDGLDWWAQAGGYHANLTWIYDVAQSTTKYEPMQLRKEDCVLWVNDCMTQIGYSNGEDYLRVRAYANDLRRKYLTDWSFVIFVLDGSNDEDGYFADESGTAWAYIGGPYMVIPNKCAGWGANSIWKIIAHETGHIFNAKDEYNTKLRTHRLSGVSLASSPGSANDLCMMKTNDPLLCEFTRREIGWIDDDHDGVFDPIEFGGITHFQKLTGKQLFSVKEKVVFYESFSRKSGWFEDSNNYVSNGAYRMYDSIYGSSSWLEKNYHDFTASVKTQWIQGSTASGYGLMVRAKTATDGYIFFINRHGQFSFGKYVNSEWKYLEPWTYSDAILIDRENTLTAKCNGNRFTLYINEVQVADVFDETFIYGNVGLTVLPGVQTAFDDLTVLSD